MRKTRTKLNPMQIIELNKIASYVCRKTNINIKEYSQFRDEEFINARTLFFMISLKKLHISYASLGSFINKDHATIYHAKKIWADRLEQNYGKYFNEFFTGEVIKTEAIKDATGKVITLTKAQLNILNDLIQLADGDLLQFHETRLKPFLKLNKLKEVSI